ncbi:uncharacterized protein LOC118737640 isoform X2 [Rhagoletis pomonella]|uniref:uncharacterized protein LOC118737640 isoform X2 n=1 Tax=Rhagoletis pomonella TaxID=28610 RepID=UPI00178687DC|nr:uncharacterized protein LOC118737640 isoform X2 [Rhagoletis pomonella]
MMHISKTVQLKCRTCLDATEKKFHSLNGQLVKDDQRKSLAEFLWDISKMDNASDSAKMLPQQICDSCLRKLKIAFSFVMQVQKLNGCILSKNDESATADKKEHARMDYHDEAPECFVDCNTSFSQCLEDPIAISQPRKRKFSSEYSNDWEEDHQESEDSAASSASGLEDNVRDRRNPKYCKNECHKEMKSMLHDLMNIQKQINTRVKGVVLYTNINLPDEGENTSQNKNVAGKDKKRFLSGNHKSDQGDRRESVRSWFPISSIEEALRVERKLRSHDYAQDVIAYLKGMKGYGVGDVLRFIFKDDLVEQYNLDGRHGKLSLNKFDSILKCVQTIFSNLPSNEFLRMVRKYVEMCHNRNKQKRRKLRRTQDFTGEAKQIEFRDEITVHDESAKIAHTVAAEINNESEQIYDELLYEDPFVSDTQCNDEVRIASLKPAIDTERCGKGTQPAIEASPPEKRRKEMKHEPLVLDSPEESQLPGGSGCKSISFKLDRTKSKGSKSTKLTEISMLFPLSTHEKVCEVEESLKDPDYAEKIRGHLNVMKDYKGEIEKVLRCSFKDNIIADYNLEGIKGRRSFRNLQLISDCLYSVFPEITMFDFSKELRRYIYMSHNRYKQKKLKSKRHLF